MYDLVSLGEVMLRMSPPRYERLRQTTRLDVRVSGSQLNVAADLARLGWSTAFVSRLPANELGLLARDTCMSYGVDMSHVQMVPGERMGVNYLEHTVSPRVSAIVYDRAGSAASKSAPGDFDWPSILDGAKVAYTDGIFPGLSRQCRETSLEFLRAAREAGCLTAFDVNYREHLGTEERARDVWSELLPLVDILVTNRSVSESVFGMAGSDEEIMRHYAAEFGCKVVCLTWRDTPSVLHGSWNSQAMYQGQVFEGKRFDFEVIDRFGTGDAFVAGLVYGYVEHGLKYGLNFGNALCALAHTIDGDVAQVSAREVTPLLNENYTLRIRR